MGVIAPSTEIGANFSIQSIGLLVVVGGGGGGGGVGDWNQRLCIMEMLHSALNL